MVDFLRIEVASCRPTVKTVVLNAVDVEAQPGVGFETDNPTLDFHVSVLPLLHLEETFDA